MAAVVVTAQNTRLDDAEALTDWLSIGGGQAAALETDFFYQQSNCVARKGTTSPRGFYLNDQVTSDLSGGGTYNTVMFKFICTSPGLLQPSGSLGQRLEIGSSNTAFHYYDVTGNDSYPLTASWLILPVDPNVPSHRDGTTGSPNLTLCNYYGLEYDQTGTSKSPNQGLDAVDIGAGLTLSRGDGGDADGTWDDFILHDQGTVANRYGYVRTVEDIIFVAGKLIIGTADPCEFTDSAETVVFPDGLFAKGFTGVSVDLQNASTVVNINTTTFLGKGSTDGGEDTRPIFTATSTAGSLDIDSSTFNNFGDITLTSACSITNSTISDSQKIIQNSATLDNCIFFGATTGNDQSFIISDDLGKIKDCAFTFSDGHAIEIDTVGTYTFDGNSFSGYGANGTDDAVIHNTTGTGTVTINVINASSPTVKTDAGGTTVVNNDVTVTLTGLVAGSEVRVFEQGTTTSVSGIENSGTTFAFSDTASDIVDIVILHLNYQYFRLNSFTIPGVGTSVPIQQIFDRNYNNP